MNHHKENKKVWVIRAGRDGQGEEAAIEKGLATIGFNDVKDLAVFSS
jgi:predicted Mrr-cat superfamily restriction endonuclease